VDLARHISVLNGSDPASVDAKISEPKVTAVCYVRAPRCRVCKTPRLLLLPKKAQRGEAQGTACASLRRADCLCVPPHPP